MSGPNIDSPKAGQSGNLFQRLSAHFPSDPASALFAELSDGRRYSYKDVLDVSARFANILVELGVAPGDRVAAQIPKSIEALMLYLGAQRAGAVFLPLNTAYTPTEIAYFLEDATPRVFVCAPESASELAAVAASAGARLETMGVYAPSAGETEGDAAKRAGSLLARGLAAPSDFNDAPREDDDLAALLYTSGTTGRSKGAALSVRNLYSNAMALAAEWRFTAEDRLLHALPIYHVHGLFVAVNVTLAAGGSLIYLPKFDVDSVVKTLPRATAMMGVPTFYTRLIDDPRFTRDVVRNMRVFISGSAPLLAETHRAFEQRTGHRILERYGMSETGMNTSNPYVGDRRAGSVGFALPGASVLVVDPKTGEHLPVGEVGSIEVRGPNVFQGYWGMPEKTAESFRKSGHFITGDLGVIDADGYLSIVGRDKDLIISGGLNVYPKEVESLIDMLPGVVESAVVGVPHPDFGEAVVAIVVPKADAELSETVVIEDLKSKIAKFKQPKRVFFADSLPRNSMGKVQKKNLRDLYAKTF
ncbi:MAG: malonyl-CoA synthase [Neomegalonema sp.]|nr:malonyl-CoA synthase [Neomegalonema sp.]